MHTDDSLIRQVKRMFEEKTGWGSCEDWTNQDFLQLSELIREQTGITISHVTLKRIWGKVKYDSLPNTHTLNTLAQFLGYDNWRDLAAKNPAAPEIPAAKIPTVHTRTVADAQSEIPATEIPAAKIPTVHTRSFADVPPEIPAATASSGSPPAAPPSVAPASTSAAPTAKTSAKTTPNRRRTWLFAIPLLVILLVLLFLHGQQPAPQPNDYKFSSKKVVSSGLPNSVVFDYDASRSPDDSVIIQQSWDTSRRVKVSKNDHQYTSVYYYPEYYHATLQVHGRVVKTHSILIKSNGWLPIIEQDPVPVYFKKEDAIHDGRLSLSIDQIHEKNIPLQPTAPTVLFANVGDFGEIYTDHFVFETSLRNEYAEGSAACQLTRIYLLCEGSAIWVPLCAKGCISNIDLYFTYFYTSGKREDLSAFGVDFKNDVKLRIESDSGRAKILINNQLAYTVPRHIIRSKIVGIDFSFQGTGSVDYVYLSNGKTSYRDDFNGTPEPPASFSSPPDKQ
jgi:hypothetical protein